MKRKIEQQEHLQRCLFSLDNMNYPNNYNEYLCYISINFFELESYSQQTYRIQQNLYSINFIQFNCGMFFPGRPKYQKK